MLDAYAEETDSRQRLELVIDFDATSYAEFERDPDERPVNINRRMDRSRLEREQNISKFLDDLDYYLEYLIVVYKHSPERLREFIMNKVLQSKKYLSKNRLRITKENCHQLASELEEIVSTNKPFDQDDNELQMIQKNYNKSGMCNIL